MSQQTDLPPYGQKTNLPLLLYPELNCQIKKKYTYISTMQQSMGNVARVSLSGHQSDFLDLISQMPWVCGGIHHSESILTVMKKLESGLYLASCAAGAGGWENFSKTCESQPLH